MLGHALEEPYQVFENNQQTVIPEQKGLVEQATADRIALSTLTTGVLPIPQESTMARQTHGQN